MAPESSSDVVVVERELALGDGMGALAVTWGVPTDSEVVGIAWVQHGYARDPGYLSALADALNAAGLIVAMPKVESFRRARSINDAAFLEAIGAALSDVVGPSGAAAEVARHAGVAVDDGVTGRIVLVAHSAGCAVVARAAERALADGIALRGIVLLDATENLSKTFASSLDGLVDCPVRGIFARPSWCNRKGQGAKALVAARSGYVGFRLTTGSHCDAEGNRTDRVCRTMCGKSDPANVDVLYDATTAWVRAFALAEVSDSWEPDGDRLTESIGADRVEVLYGTAGSGSNR